MKKIFLSVWIISLFAMEKDTPKIPRSHGNSHIVIDIKEDFNAPEQPSTPNVPRINSDDICHFILNSYLPHEDSQKLQDIIPPLKQKIKELPSQDALLASAMEDAAQRNSKLFHLNGHDGLKLNTLISDAVAQALESKTLDSARQKNESDQALAKSNQKTKYVACAHIATLAVSGVVAGIITYSQICHK